MAPYSANDYIKKYRELCNWQLVADHFKVSLSTVKRKVRNSGGKLYYLNYSE